MTLSTIVITHMPLNRGPLSGRYWIEGDEGPLNHKCRQVMYTSGPGTPIETEYGKGLNATELLEELQGIDRDVTIHVVENSCRAFNIVSEIQKTEPSARQYISFRGYIAYKKYGWSAMINVPGFMQDIGLDYVARIKEDLTFEADNLLSLLDLDFVHGIVNPLSVQDLWQEKLPRFLFSLDPPNSLCVFLGISGIGKSTMINELRCWGAKRIPKVTTRKLRSGENPRSLISVSPSYFDSLSHHDILVGQHTYRGNMYGLMKDHLQYAMNSREAYVLDSADIVSALKLKDVCPEFVKLIAIAPEKEFVGHGIELRAFNANDCPGLCLPEEEQEQRAKQTIRESRYRLDRIRREDEEFRKHLDKCDYVLTSSDLQTNIDDFCRYALGS